MIDNGTRPRLTASTPVNDFLAYYWLKQELIDFCREHNLKTTGSKMAITARIAHWIQTGQSPLESTDSTKNIRSAGEPVVIALDAPLTASYTNSEHVRSFFKSMIGTHFRFTVGFMTFCRENPTKTFGDAVRYWQTEHDRKRDPSYQSEIASQFEYNQYIRDFRADNPGGIVDRRHCLLEAEAKSAGR